MHFSFRQKIIFAVIFISSLSIIIVSLLSINNTNNLLNKQNKDFYINQIKILKNLLEYKLDNYRSDIAYNQTNPQIHQILINYHLNKSIKKSTYLNVVHQFKSLLTYKKNYKQIRIISFKDGMELLRVDKKNNKIIISQKENLANKKNEFYYNEIYNNPYQYSYVSRFSLNREHGKVTYPHEIMIRVATPIYKDVISREKIGFIILNIDFKDFIEAFRKNELNNGKLRLVNSFGDLLFDSNFDTFDNIESNVEKKDFLYQTFVNYNKVRPKEYLNVYYSPKNLHFIESKKYHILLILDWTPFKATYY